MIISVTYQNAVPATMRAWRLDGLGGTLRLQDIALPQVRPGSVLVRIEASALPSYIKAYVEGKLPAYSMPHGPFTIGTNAVGVVTAVGPDVWHLEPGQRVILSSHLDAAENVEDSAQILIGLTAIGPEAGQMQGDWRDGTLAEYALMPKAAVTPVGDLDEIDSSQLVTMTRFIVPLGGLLRGRLAAGETLVVTGATGAYGTAAVLLGLAMGAGRAVAVGRNARALEALAEVGGPRVRTVALFGDIAADAAAIRAAAGRGAHLAFDMVGQATEPNATLAALRSLRRGGRLVLMGSMSAPLPLTYSEVMFNNWEIIGQFMYPVDAYRRLLDLLRTGLLDAGKSRHAPFHSKRSRRPWKQRPPPRTWNASSFGSSLGLGLDWIAVPACLAATRREPPARPLDGKCGVVIAVDLGPLQHRRCKADGEGDLCPP
jgi:alcohol dehydrogenase